jgi:septal ring factor EnvC (AmiA/AmiB activator)
MSKWGLARAVIAVGLATAARLHAQIPSTGLVTTPVAAAQDVQAAASAAIPVLVADSAAAASLSAQYARDIAEQKAKLDQLNQQIKTMKEQIDEIKQAIAKLEAMMATLETVKAKLEAEIKHAKSSLNMVRQVVVDRSAASRLLDAMKQRDPTIFIQFIDQTSSPSTIVSVDIVSPDAIKMVFRVGTLSQCIATKSLCGTAKYSIIK